MGRISQMSRQLVLPLIDQFSYELYPQDDVYSFNRERERRKREGSGSVPSFWGTGKGVEFTAPFASIREIFGAPQTSDKSELITDAYYTIEAIWYFRFKNSGHVLEKRVGPGKDSIYYQPAVADLVLVGKLANLHASKRTFPHKFFFMVTEHSHIPYIPDNPNRMAAVNSRIEYVSSFVETTIFASLITKIKNYE